MTKVSAANLKVIDCRYQIPVEPIVFVLSPVGVFDDAEYLALPVSMLHRHPDSCLLSVVIFLLFGERVLLAWLEGQYRLCVQLNDSQEAQVSVDCRVSAHPYFTFLPELEVMHAALAAADA